MDELELLDAPAVDDPEPFGCSGVSACEDEPWEEPPSDVERYTSWTHPEFAAPIVLAVGERIEPFLGDSGDRRLLRCESVELTRGEYAALWEQSSSAARREITHEKHD